jgi:ubiquinone/menaquinone biosynthesis C-methylase UbiE
MKGHRVKEGEVAYEELKQRQSVMWGNGPYQRITETLDDIHDLVIETLAPAPGDRWLDLATGTGAIAERAASAGASVTGIDLAPALIETAKERAAEKGLDIDYRVGDAERLDLPDAGFDKVSSTLGIMFAPDHEAVARELARVTAPGGKLVLANWTPTGGLGRMFKVMAPYQPAPPPSSPFDWGDEPRVRELLGDGFELEIAEHVSTLRTPSAEDSWELFATSYGPTKTLAESIGERREDLHRDWVEFFETNYRQDGEIVHTREYLLISGIRR